MLENRLYFSILYNFTYFKKWLKSLKKCSTSFKELIVFFLQVLKLSFFFLGGEGFFGGGFGFEGGGGGGAKFLGGGGGRGHLQLFLLFSHLYKVGIETLLSFIKYL